MRKAERKQSLPSNGKWPFSRGFIRRSWNGVEPIWHVFWLYGVPVLVLAFPLSLPYPSRLFVVIFFTFFIWLQVSLWRCAFVGRFRWFGYIARTAVFAMILFELLLLLSLVMPTYQGF